MMPPAITTNSRMPSTMQVVRLRAFFCISLASSIWALACTTFSLARINYSLMMFRLLPWSSTSTAMSCIMSLMRPMSCSAYVRTGAPSAVVRACPATAYRATRSRSTSTPTTIAVGSVRNSPKSLLTVGVELAQGAGKGLHLVALGEYQTRQGLPSVGMLAHLHLVLLHSDHQDLPCAF